MRQGSSFLHKKRTQPDLIVNIAHYKNIDNRQRKSERHHRS